MCITYTHIQCAYLYCQAHVHCDLICTCTHAGKDETLDTADRRMTHAVVMRLVDPVKERGHHVYLDNYYTSPALFADLNCRGFGACGTVRTDR